MSEGASTTIDPAEVARFERIAETWWDPKGPCSRGKFLPFAARKGAYT